MTTTRTFRHPLGMVQRLAVADLLCGGGDALVGLARGRQVAVVYSDPPWNPGNEKWWRRHAGAEPPEDYDHLLDAWCRVIATLGPEHVFVEQSTNARHRGLLIAAVERCPGWRLPLVEEWTVYYGSPGSRSCARPNVLLHFGHEPLRGDPTGLRGEAMTACVFDALALPRGALVADPCMGKGMTSRQAHRCGLDAIGTELASHRLDRTIEWLEKQGYEEEVEDMSRANDLVDAIRVCAALPEAERVEVYNAASRALGEIVADLAPDPACAPQLVLATAVEANDYNPNRVAAPELDLLEGSMRADGITMAVVVMPDPDGERWTVIDGFHRRVVATERLGRRYIPCAVIDRPLADRMASTVRHNRARGKHQVELMAALVRGMMGLGWDDGRIAAALGMSEEELLRLKQMVGAAKLLAADEFSKSWGPIDGE